MCPKRALCTSCSARPAGPLLAAWCRDGFTKFLQVKTVEVSRHPSETEEPSLSEPFLRRAAGAIAREQLFDIRKEKAPWLLLQCVQRAWPLGAVWRPQSGGAWKANTTSLDGAPGLDSVDHQLEQTLHHTESRHESKQPQVPALLFTSALRSSLVLKLLAA